MAHGGITVKNPVLGTRGSMMAVCIVGHRYVAVPEAGMWNMV